MVAQGYGSSGLWQLQAMAIPGYGNCSSEPLTKKQSSVLSLVQLGVGGCALPEYIRAQAERERECVTMQHGVDVADYIIVLVKMFGDTPQHKEKWESSMLLYRPGQDHCKYLHSAAVRLRSTVVDYIDPSRCLGSTSEITRDITTMII